MPRQVRSRINSQFRPAVATSPRDCGVSTTEEQIRHGTGGALVLGPAAVRARMDNRSSWTTPLHTRRAVNSIDNEARRHGLEPLRYHLAGRESGGYFLAGASKQSLINRCKRGELLDVVIDYRKLNQLYPGLSGSPLFNGRHRINIGGYAGKKADGSRKLGIRMRNGAWEVQWMDPTWNRPGTPKGPRFVRLSKLWRVADGAWSDRGGRGWVGGSVSPAVALPKPPPPEEPIDPCADAVAELEAERDDAVAALIEAEELILALRVIPARVRDQLTTIRDELAVLAPVVDAADDLVSAGTEVPQV